MAKVSGSAHVVPFFGECEKNQPGYVSIVTFIDRNLYRMLHHRIY